MDGRRIAFFRPPSPFDRWNTLPKRSASCPFSGISWESIHGFPIGKGDADTADKIFHANP
jgi:hypothetical protein